MLTSIWCDETKSLGNIEPANLQNATGDPLISDRRWTRRVRRIGYTKRERKSQIYYTYHFTVPVLLAAVAMTLRKRATKKRKQGKG